MRVSVGGKSRRRSFNVSCGLQGGEISQAEERRILRVKRGKFGLCVMAKAKPAVDGNLVLWCYK